MTVDHNETEGLTRKVLITDKTLQTVKPAPKGKRRTIWDTLLPGFAVRVSDKRKINFYAVRRRAGEPQPSWIKLGSYPEKLPDGLILADARAKARDALGALLEGKNPAGIAEEKRLEQARQKADTFDAVAEDFVQRLESGGIRKARGGAGPLRGASEMASVVRREFLGQVRQGGGWVDGAGPWRGRPIKDISRRDMRAAIESISERDDGGLYRARHAFAAARRLFAWATARDIIETNPCEGLRPADLYGVPAARDRVLNDDELRLVWRAAGACGYPFGPLVRLLLLTGQRRDEIGNAQWSEFEGALLTIPALRMKGTVAHTVPFGPVALEILETLPRHQGGDYLFSTMGGARPVSGFGKMKKRLDALMLQEARAGAPEPEKVTIAPFTLHDLRRTMRTRLSSLGVLPVIAELVIGHKQAGIVAVYDRHRYDAEKRAALEAWERLLLSIVEPKGAPGNVVKMARARA